MNKVILGLILAVCVLGLALVMLNERLGREPEGQQAGSIGLPALPAGKDSQKDAQADLMRQARIAPEEGTGSAEMRFPVKETAEALENARAAEALAPPVIPETAAATGAPQPETVPEAAVAPQPAVSVAEKSTESMPAPAPVTVPEPTPPVSVEPPQTAPAPAPEPARVSPPARQPEAAGNPVAQQPPRPAAEAAPKVEAAKPAPKASPRAEKNITRFVVFSRENGATVRISGNGPLNYKSMVLENPNRVVLDLDGEWKFPASGGIPKNDLVNNVRIGKNGNNTRVVIDLKEKPRVSRFVDAKTGNSVDIRVDK